MVTTAAAAVMILGEQGIFLVALIQSELMELFSQNVSSDSNVDTEFHHCALLYSQHGVDESTEHSRQFPSKVLK